MKTSRKLIVLAALLLGFSATSFAQSGGATAYPEISAMANVFANIQSPTTVSKVADMNFGVIFKDPAAAGTVAMVAAQVTSCKSTNLAVSGYAEAACFQFMGGNNTVHNITFPMSPIQLWDASHTNFINLMLDVVQPVGAIAKDGMVNTVGSTGQNIAFTLGDGGQFVFYVGGSLFINKNQPSGSYSSTVDLQIILNN